MSQRELRKIDVDYFVTYLTETDGIQWTDENYQAMKMVKAIKGLEYKGYIDLVISGEKRKIYSENAEDFRKLAYQPLARMIREKYSLPVAIVPIPSSKTTIDNCDSFLTKTLADSAAKSLGGSYRCAPILTFKSEMPPSRTGGSRSPYFIESQLHVGGAVDLPIVLLDDVMTLGGHLKAACWKLANEGMTVIGAVTFARTVKDNCIKPFDSHTEALNVSKMEMSWDF